MLALLPAISTLHRRRVERQRRDAVEHEHDGPRRTPAIVGLQIPLAHVTGVDTILPVRRRERRNQRAVVIAAIRAGQRIKLPTQRASTADQLPLGRRRDDCKVRLTATQRAVRVRPQGQLGSRLQDLCTSGKEWPHRQCQDLISSAVVVRRRRGLCVSRLRRHHAALGRCPIPAFNDRHQTCLSVQRLHALVLCRFKRIKPTHDLCGLP